MITSSVAELVTNAHFEEVHGPSPEIDFLLGIISTFQPDLRGKISDCTEAILQLRKISSAINAGSNVGGSEIAKILSCPSTLNDGFLDMLYE